MNEINSEYIMKEIKDAISAGVPYIDAIVDFAEKNNIEIEVVGEMIRRSPLLKAKIHVEAEELNMLEPIARLPV